jgi:branched-chain amino acid transport system ATP-binding protein
LQRCHHSCAERYVAHFDVLQRVILLFRPFLHEESLFDETSLGLAPKVIEEIYERINEINRSGGTFVIVEQNARKALRTGHRGYVLDLRLNRLEDTGEGLLNNEEVKRL